ncbi:MAG: RidA family protein [Chitinivibrionales bacterium]
MKPNVVHSNDAPQPIGPYSQAIVCGDLVFLSGQIAIDPASGELTGADVSAQTKRIFQNIRALLAELSLDTGSLVKTTVYLADMGSFAGFNSVYEKELNGWKPARSVVEVSRLPKNALVEIEAVACR